MHLILVGACYVDTILSVPHFPGEDDKLRATAVQVRRGGNCANAIEVMQQLVTASGGRADALRMHLVSCLPDLASPSAAMIAASLGAALPAGGAALSSGRAGRAGRAGLTDWAETPLATSIFRAGHDHAASCYILRSAATGSRTIVNHSDLPEMTYAEFAAVAARFSLSPSTDSADSAWWHFEGRIPETLLQCIRHVQDGQDDRAGHVTVSVEVEKPGRDGLRELAAVADVVFYSKTWAESEGYASAAACLEGEAARMAKMTNARTLSSKILFCTWGASGASAWHAGGLASVPAPSVPAASIVDSVGAGDTFTAGILYRLSTSKHGERGLEAVRDALAFAVGLASRKIQLDGFQGLGETSP